MADRIIKTFILSIFSLGTISYSAEISINRIDDAYGWQRKTLTVSADSIISNISSFNLTIAFSQSSSLVYEVRPGQIFDDCGWEYFNCRLIRADSVVTYLPDYPVHLISVTGIASLSENSPPNCVGVSKSLFHIDLVLERLFHRQDKFLPFRFFWRDCFDNVLVSKSGEEIFGAQGLFENISPTQTHEPISSEFPGYGFPQTACSPKQGASVEYNLNFVNSGVSPMVVDSLGCDAGDVNLNGVYYEVSDAVLLIDYFTKGIIIFEFPAAQIAQTDCNCDGTVLTVADLVCFIRNSLGSDQSYKVPVLAEGGTFISSKINDNARIFTLTTTSDLVLSYLKMQAKIPAVLNPADIQFSFQNFITGQIGDTITMILVDLEGNPVLSAGEHQLFEYTGSSDFEIAAWVVDMSGQETALKLESSPLPESPELLQNYPNPFNPSTTIEFNLPLNSTWQLEIYNVAGQHIRNFSGLSSGLTKVEWDGTNSIGVSVASGVYFYKLISDNISVSRKMLLLK